MGNNHDHHRESDATIARVEQKLDDLLEKFDDHLKWANEQVKEDGARISALEKAWRKVEYPVLAVGLIVTGLMLWVGKCFGLWIARHWS